MFLETLEKIREIKEIKEEMRKGAFTEWCKKNNMMDMDSTDVPCKCIKQGLKSDDEHVRKMTRFAANMNNC